MKTNNYFLLNYSLLFSKVLVFAFFLGFSTSLIAGAGSNLISGDVTITVNYNDLKLSLDIKAWQDYPNCDEEVFDVGVAYRLGTSGTWLKIYGNKADQFPGSQPAYVGPAYTNDYRSTGNLRFDLVEFTNLPGDFFSQTVQIQVVGKWGEWNAPNGNGNPFTPCASWANGGNYNRHTYTLNNSIGTPRNLSSTLDQFCDKVLLNWNLGANQTPNNRRFKVYRKELPNGNYSLLNGNVTDSSYNDYSAQSGVNYEYRVVAGVFSNNQFGTGGQATVQGRRQGIEAPSGVYIDQVNCNGHLQVNWNFSGGTNPTKFYIARAQSPDMNYNKNNFQVSGSDRTFRDVNTVSGQNYYYTVRSYTQGGSGCSIESAHVGANAVGNGIPTAPIVSSVVPNVANKSVTINWSQNSLEDNFKVVRSSNTGTNEFTVGKDITSYIDDKASACVNYNYEVKAINNQCAVNGVVSNNSLAAYIPADVSTTFDNNNNKIEATDGEYGDRIVLKWKSSNRQNDNWIINRIDPQTNDTLQIAGPSGSTKFFTDNTANANTLYKYLIQGELDCAGNLLQSNTSEDIGFRLSYGTVNGQITYAGGTAVKGVKVTATAASGASGRSATFSNGNSTGRVPAAKATDFESNEITTMAYIRPHSVSGLYSIINKHNNTNGFKLEVNNRTLVFTSGALAVNAPIPNYNVNSWTAVAATSNLDSITLYANGKQIGKFANTSNTLNTVSDFLIGNNFDGEIDEVRVFNRALTDLEIARSFDVYINPSSPGLKGYWRFDEGFGNTAYDYSKTLQTANKNHLVFTSLVTSNVKPSTSQLTAGAYTDSLGSYFIPFIPYLGSGDNFTIIPQYGTHSFAPATTTLLIGSGSANYTGQDFTDQSSFNVSGNVMFAGLNDTTNCAVKDVRILIDGEVVVKNGEVATTNDSGNFSIQVPIGPHVITVEKTSHDFLAGRFPSSGAHNFQQNINGINFLDSTLVKVVGRVAGGGIQKSLPPALGRGKNNIGQATVAFEPIKVCNVNPNRTKGSNKEIVEVTTNSSTGEYVAMLPPLRYKVPIATVTNQLTITFPNQTTLDISNVPPVQTSSDSVFNQVNNKKVFARVDSAKFQTQRDFIYSETPVVNVLGKEQANVYGADTITYSNSGNTTKIPTAALNLDYPVFEENKEYTWLISAFEIYENKDGANSVFDSVPMTAGRITINNNVSNETEKVFEYALTDTVRFDGIQEYTFTAGQAETSMNSITPKYSYTKTCQVQLLTDAGGQAEWEPNPTDAPKYFRGIVFGGRALGNSFATQGPQVVTMILRDPPGTGSTASWEKSSAVTNSFSFGVEAGIATSLTKELSMGTEFDVGLGYTTPTKIELSANNNISTETSIGVAGELIETTTNSLGISTGGGDEFVGANADLFFGRSMNMDFGLSQVLSLIEDANCNGNCGSTAYNFNGTTYRIGTTVSMFAIPKGYETEFVFTQAGIENSVIPKLEALRDQLLINHADYSSFLNASDPNFGKSNDDAIFGTAAKPDPENNAMEDSLGLSYHFTGYKRTDTLYTSPFTNTTKLMTFYDGVDSVWWYNKQIKLWEQTLERNERAKVFSNSGNLDRNISYQGGSSITYTTSTTKSVGGSISLNFNLSKEMTLAVGAEVGGTGASIEQATSISMSTNATAGTSKETSATFSYTLDDPDSDDEFTVDVFKSNDGYGPIFKTRGGQTSCPYQGEVKTKYYKPVTVLDKATIQLDQPRLVASPVNLFNVPANGQGNITLSLINDGLEDAIYSFKVLENTNPNGAIIKIDGINPNRNFAVPAQTSITKTLVVEKGPNHIAYDSIGLVFHSECQYAFGTAGYDDIADTVYVSVNFLASCTDVSVFSPQNQFVANNSYDNKLPVIISNYDINYGGLEKIQLQYKPSNQAAWIPVATEWFKEDPNGSRTHADTLQIPRNQSYISYQLDMKNLTDQTYDLRAISTCKIPFNPKFSQESAVISGVVDRVNPHPFGTPSPADGVLDPNDDISIQFNETIEAGTLTASNFQITGVVNGQELRHDKAVAFDGATGYMEIANGFDFASNDFTIEFWAKRDAIGTKQTVISQGVASNNKFSIGFNTSNNIEVNLGNSSYTSSFAIQDMSYWHHYTVTYDKNNLTLEITERDAQTSQVSPNNNFFSTYTSGGKTFIGKNAENNGDWFNGSIHQLRIWNKTLTSGEVSSRINQNLNGREAGLVGYWPMDEGRGIIAEDKARFRHAEMKANWEINPKSKGAAFDGISQYVVVDTAGTIAMTQEMDLSIEFWFKTSGGRLQTFLSNGSGRFISTDANRNGWNIEMNAQNEIWVKNDSFAFKAVQNNYADNIWHHFALVVNRLANTTAYIDGIQQKTVSSANFWGFGAAKLAVGARYSINGTQESFDQYFSGNMDEVRIWNTALLRENIELNRYNRLKGDEFGLLAYYPFESYRLELGVPVLDASMANQSNILVNPARINSKAVNGLVFSLESPAIALQRPVEKIKYSWSVNNDKIVITPNEQAANIENVTLNISVKDVKDLHGNIMQSPKTWIAYVNKNQVLWQDAEKNLAKEFNDTMTFTSKVINSGGEVKNYTISNIPAWLSVSPSSGTINPLSTKTIRFTVNPAINIGDYAEDLILTTDFGFNEKLLVKLKVRKTAPAFTFNKNLYAKSMNFIGQIAINGRISVNNEDKLVAYINNEVRGVANLRYVPSLDQYIAFLDVYTNTTDSVFFKVWNASKGELHENVSPSTYFVENALVGSLNNPTIFNAVDNLSKPIVLNRGWNWVSFPLVDGKMKSITSFLQGLNFANGDVIKTVGNNAFAQYGGTSLGWSGGLTRNGFNNHQSYMIYISNTDTINYKGMAIDPDTMSIPVVQGWNRIGFISTKNMELNTALANYNATDGDLIKSQQGFAVYQSNLGWIGSLTTMEPTEGYLLKAANSANFVYPRRGLFRLKGNATQEKLVDVLPPQLVLNPNDFETSTNAIIKINTCEEILEDSTWSLVAFNENNVRGYSSAAIKVNEAIGSEYFVTIYGNVGENYRFEMLNSISKEKMHVIGQLSFLKDQVHGKLDKPLYFELTKKVDCEQFKKLDENESFANAINGAVYPNPFTNYLNIYVPSKISENGRVELIDQNGRVMYETKVGNSRKIQLNGAQLRRLSSGVYQLRFIDGDHVIVEKLVKL